MYIDSLIMDTPLSRYKKDITGYLQKIDVLRAEVTNYEIL